MEIVFVVSSGKHETGDTQPESELSLKAGTIQNRMFAQANRRWVFLVCKSGIEDGKLAYILRKAGPPWLKINQMLHDVILKTMRRDFV